MTLGSEQSSVQRPFLRYVVEANKPIKRRYRYNESMQEYCQELN